jgi:hypothetical protein
VRILTLVHTWTPYESTRAKLIDESWAKDLEDFFFICDSDEFGLTRSINLGPYPPGPTYHPETVIRIFRLFMSKRFENFDWLYIVDDDTYCFPHKLRRFLEFYDPGDCLMMGDFLNWPRDHPGHKQDYSSWVGGGPGIVFSRSAVKALLFYAMKTNLWYYAVKTKSNLLMKLRFQSYGLRSIASALVVHVRQMRHNLRKKPPFPNHDVWLHELVRRDGSYHVKGIHVPGFHQNGHAALKRYELTSNLLISVHLEHDLSLINRIHNGDSSLRQSN